MDELEAHISAQMEERAKKERQRKALKSHLADMRAKADRVETERKEALEQLSAKVAGEIKGYDEEEETDLAELKELEKRLHGVEQARKIKLEFGE